MTQTIQSRLNDIRERSAEYRHYVTLPAVDPTTGAPKPFRFTSQSDDDVVFLLERLDEALDEVTRLEDIIERTDAPAEDVHEYWCDTDADGDPSDT